MAMTETSQLYSVRCALFESDFESYRRWPRDLRPAREAILRILGTGFAQLPCGTHSNAESNPSKYLLYQDTLMGLFDKHVMDGFDDYYAETAETLWNAAARNGRYSYLFETLASLCDVLKNKSEVGVKIKNAYHKKDVQELQRIVDKTLPEIIAGAEKFRDAIEKQWF